MLGCHKDPALGTKALLVMERTARQSAERRLEEALVALQALRTMSDRGPQPSKFNEALSWRDNDIEARRLVDAVLEDPDNARLLASAKEAPDV